MKAFCFFLILIVSVLLLKYDIVAQEDVLRPHGRTREELKKLPWYKPPNKITVGLEGGCNYNMFSQEIYPSDNQMYNVLKNQQGISPYFSVILDYYLSQNFTLELLGFLDWKSFRNSSTSNFNYTFSPKIQTDWSKVNMVESTITVESTADFSTETTGMYFGLGLLGKSLIIDKLFISAGPICLIPVGDFNLNNEINVVEPEFIKNKTAVPPTKVDNLNMLYGIELGIGWSYSISNKIELVPSIRYQYIMNEFAKDFYHQTLSDILYPGSNKIIVENNKELSSLQIGIAIFYNINRY